MAGSVIPLLCGRAGRPACLLDRSSRDPAFGSDQVTGILVNINALSAAAIPAGASHRVIESGEPPVIGKVHIRAFRDQVFNHFVPAPKCRPVERRLLKAAHASIDFSTVRQQQIERCDGAILHVRRGEISASIGVDGTHAGCGQRGRHSGVIGQIDDGTMFEQQLDGWRVLRLGRAQ